MKENSPLPDCGRDAAEIIDRFSTLGLSATRPLQGLAPLELPSSSTALRVADRPQSGKGLASDLGSAGLCYLGRMP